MICYYSISGTIGGTILYYSIAIASIYDTHRLIIGFTPNAISMMI